MVNTPNTVVPAAHEDLGAGDGVNTRPFKYIDNESMNQKVHNVFSSNEEMLRNKGEIEEEMNAQRSLAMARRGDNLEMVQMLNQREIQNKFTSYVHLKNVAKEEGVRLVSGEWLVKYCKKGGLDVDGCKVIRIVHPKLLMVLPKIEEFADSCGNPSKWFICASVEKNIVICHPGPVSRYTTNRYTYKQSELREFDLGQKEECTAKTFKRRKRKFVVKEKERSFPTSLGEINEGRHRGFRDVFACGIALAEFGAAKREAREVSVDKALAGFLVNPFEWGNDRVASNNLFVLWTSPDGQHHINGATLRSLMIMIM